MRKLIFDFDGTLVDSMKQWASKMTYILDVNGVSYPKDIIKIITPLGDRGTAEYFINGLGLNLTVEQTVEMMDCYAIEEYKNNIPAKTTVEAALHKLKTMGYSLNILTASPHRMLDVCLKRIGIFELFENVWSCDDFNTSKSDVNIYKAVAQRLNTATENCVFFDDNINALRTAKQSGMRVVGVFDESSQEYIEEIKSTVAIYIYKLNEILNYNLENL